MPTCPGCQQEFTEIVKDFFDYLHWNQFLLDPKNMRQYINDSDLTTEEKAGLLKNAQVVQSAYTEWQRNGYVFNEQVREYILGLDWQ